MKRLMKKCELDQNMQTNLLERCKFVCSKFQQLDVTKNNVSFSDDTVSISMGTESTFEINIKANNSLQLNEIIVTKNGRIKQTRDQYIFEDFLNSGLGFINWVDSCLNELS